MKVIILPILRIIFLVLYALGWVLYNIFSFFWDGTVKNWRYGKYYFFSIDDPSKHGDYPVDVEAYMTAWDFIIGKTVHLTYLSGVPYSDKEMYGEEGN